MKIEEKLKKLEQKSIHILREVKSQFKNPGIMWSTGKDSSSMLWLCKKAFYGQVPFPVIFIDTGNRHAKEIYDFRDKLVEKWDLDLIISKNEEAINNGVGPEKNKFDCCHQLKTLALKQTISKHNFDSLIVSIRRDEHHMREREHFMSPRDKNFGWKLFKEQEVPTGDSEFESLQDIEFAGWDIYATEFKDSNHVRVHPILHWTELEIWEYIKQENMPFNPLYSAQKRNGRWSRFRSLGCKPCTDPIKSKAKTIDEIIEELKTTEIKERSGRSQDKENIMRRLRALGYL